MAQMVKTLCAIWETWVRSLEWEDPLKRLFTPVFWPGEFHGLQSMELQSRIQLSDFHFKNNVGKFISNYGKSQSFN